MGMKPGQRANNRAKPTHLRVIQGNPGKRPLPKDEPEPKLGVPKCPSHLTPDAKKEWKRVTPLLAECGLVSEIDMAALAAYCQCYGRWVECERLIAKNPSGSLTKSPNGYPVQHPALGIANRAMRSMYSFLAEFGMTPSARTRIKTGGQQPVDPFDELLGA